MVQNGIFWTIGEQSYFVYYPIMSYRRINVYRIETMDIGRSHCKNGVSRTVLIFISTVILIVRDKYFGRIPTMICVRTWSHTLNNVQLLLSNFSKEQGRLIA